MKILLASQSPRRKDLLQNLGYNFQIVSVECDESYPEDMHTDQVAGFLSLQKANAYGTLEKNEILLTADTIVATENKILGKPRDKEEAIQMLQLLSDKTHQVYTGITLKSSEKTITETDVAHVTFSNISLEEIHYYTENYKPYDKAGAYGIQEWLGMAKISRIDGSYYTIMGLPTHLVYRLLQDYMMD